MNRDELVEHLHNEIASRDERIGELENVASYYASRNEELREEVAATKAQDVVMPEGWIPLTIEHEPGYPEDVAFGPKRMMDRLKKWLDRYFEMRLTAAPVSSGDPEKCSYQDDPRSPAELSLAGCNCVRFGECNPHWPCKLHTPAADAGIVDMYRHLQKVTPYRFKKIQDASITDGGDVMYFHKDRFDAALLADMAAHCAAKGVV